MDEIVRAALRKWPQVPACHGWLALDERGDWYMRDERIQTQGPFPKVKGSRIEHDKLKAFIARNYEHDEHGGWYFQNGPQRVYVDLAATPWIWRLQASDTPGDAAPRVASHTGLTTACEQSLLDEGGRLYLLTPLGLGLVHSQDMHVAADALERGWQSPAPVMADELPGRFGFVRQPRP
jgi:hypothetical protein